MKSLRTLVTTMAALLLFAGVPLLGQYAPSGGSNLSRVAGRFVANNYNYPTNTTYITGGGNGATGTGSIQVVVAQVQLPDGRSIYPFNLFSPIIVGPAGSTAELITPTGVSNCYTLAYQSLGTCTLTASFTYIHYNGEAVISGTAGAAEAAYDAFLTGGGMVVVDNQWAGGINTACSACYASASAALAALLPFQNVNIEDDRGGVTQNWMALPSTTTLLAAPTVYTAAATCVLATLPEVCSDATVAGSASWGSTVYGCYTLVDINGNESPCSATASYTSVASKAIDMAVSLTARTDNVVGWKPYLSVSGGSYALAYSVPLLAQPTALLAVPVSAGVCTLTVLETTTPTCAIANSLYNQAGSTVGVTTLFKGGAQFTGYPVVTNTLAPEIGSASATEYNPNEEAHATYAYVPGNRIGVPLVQAEHIVFPITAAAQTTVGEVAGSFPLPANFMNQIGRTIEVCGLFVKTSTTADTLTKFQLWWDAEGSNVTAGTPVQLTNMQSTYATALAAAANFQFCQQVTTTVASTSATGGSITPGQGWLTVGQVSAGANPSAGSTNLVAAVGSLNLALPAHLTLLVNHTTGTDGAGATLIGATLRIIN